MKARMCSVLLVVGACAPHVNPCDVCAAIQTTGCEAVLAKPNLITDPEARAVAVKYCETHAHK